MDTAAPNSTEVTPGNSIMKPNENLRRGLLAKQAARRLGGRLQGIALRTAGQRPIRADAWRGPPRSTRSTAHLPRPVRRAPCGYRKCSSPPVPTATSTACWQCWHPTPGGTSTSGRTARCAPWYAALARWPGTCCGSGAGDAGLPAAGRAAGLARVPRPGPGRRAGARHARRGHRVGARHRRSAQAGRPRAPVVPGLASPSAQQPRVTIGAAASSLPVPRGDASGGQLRSAR